MQIVGPLADSPADIYGDYAPHVNKQFLQTPYSSLKTLGKQSSFATGCDNAHCGNYDWLSVKHTVQDSDLVIICLGTGVFIEQEGYDRDSLSLPGFQQNLLEDAVAFGSSCFTLFVC